MSENLTIRKSELTALNEAGTYDKHHVETSSTQVVGLGRRPETEYAVNAVVYEDTNPGIALQCTVAGTTNNLDLDLTSVSVGDTINDGTVTWKLIKRTYVDELDADTAILSAMINTVQNKNGMFSDELIGTISKVADTDAFVANHEIATGKFTGIKVGNKVRINTASYQNNWLVFGINPHWNKGDTALTRHHIGLIPETPLFNAPMNDTDVTTGGYKGSKMYRETIPALVAELQVVLGEHLLLHRRILSNTVNSSCASSSATWATGASTEWEWTDVYAVLPSESEIYGAPIWSSSGYDQGEANSRLPLFNFINPVQYSRWNFWLRCVGGSTDFCVCDDRGSASRWNASYSFGVRPLILLG